MNVDAKLGRNVFKLDKNSHIDVRHEICRTRCTKRYCLFVCPSNVYSWSEERDQVHIEFEGCLECGACVIACRHDAIQWRYPQAGFGAQFRFG